MSPHLRKPSRDSLGRPSFCPKLVRPRPSIFDFSRRCHPALVGAATSEFLEISRATRIFPAALDRDLPAGRNDLPFKNTEVAVAVGMLVDEIAALRTIASDQVGRAPVRDLRIVPIVVGLFLDASDLEQAQVVVGNIGQRNDRL